MQKIMIQPREVLQLLRITSDRFVQLLDLGRLPAEIIDDVIVFDLKKLRELDLSLPKSLLFPKSGYASVGEAMSILGVSRRTFYLRVAKKEFTLHKEGRRSYVKLTDLYANDELF